MLLSRRHSLLLSLAFVGCAAGPSGSGATASPVAPVALPCPAPPPPVADSGVAAAPESTPPPAPPDAGTPRPYVRQAAGNIVLTHVLLFDGTLAPPRPDQTVVLKDDKIVEVGPAASVTAPPGATVLDLSGRAVLPGLVGMHNHLYYIQRAGVARGDTDILLPELFYSAPRLYLAGGVTTMRTTGCIEPYADLNLRRLIDSGKVPGPALDVTAPYLEGPGGFFPQMPAVKDAAEARRFVAYWADAGATSVKAYMHISRAALKAAIDEAHRHKMKVTGHLCSVTYGEAASLGIDDLEHGFFEATDFDDGKKPDECPRGPAHAKVLSLDPESPEVKGLLHTLVSHHVAVTSTLPVFEQGIPGRKQDLRGISLLAPQFRANYEAARKRIDAGAWGEDWEKNYKDDLRLERAFVAAGGLLLAGPDPTGNGGVIPGFGDQKEIELLVEAGFSPVEAIHIGTYNGAAYLGRLDTIGTVAKGKQADLVVVRGDPGAKIEAIEDVEWVFKKGAGYDPEALVEAVRGKVGLY
ncbi:MAG TPA: amidohydrolase family protein [Polyangiaceae bacterium]|jgi:imidazolonepropionase-like amidohydrolase